MKNLVIITLALTLSGCSMFSGPKTRLVPQAYMPEAPEILMRKPKELNTIRTEPAKTDSPEGSE